MINTINTVEGLLFRAYLCRYNLSLLHKCIKATMDDYENEAFLKSSLCKTEYLFNKAIVRARRLTEEWLDYCQKNNIQIIAHFHEHYPKQLVAIKDFPPLLFIKGQLPVKPLVAVIGKREASPMAERKTGFIVRTFAEKGLGILSGLALGIDTLAHKEAIKQGVYTLAVLPKALNDIFPSENADLANSILQNGGALISEQAPGYSPAANTFVLRNRLQAALSEYIIPVEMGVKSGTQYTIQYAYRYGKKIIFSLPGPLEIDHFLPCYDGIIAAVKKYRPRESTNIMVIKDLQAISELLRSEQSNIQPQLFSS